MTEGETNNDYELIIRKQQKLIVAFCQQVHDLQEKLRFRKAELNELEAELEEIINSIKKRKDIPESYQESFLEFF